MGYTGIGQKGNPEKKWEQKERAEEKTIVGNHHQYCGCSDESGLTVTQLPYANPSGQTFIARNSYRRERAIIDRR